jgi:hypothetical protein
MLLLSKMGLMVLKGTPNPTNFLPTNAKDNINDAQT